MPKPTDTAIVSTVSVVDQSEERQLPATAASTTLEVISRAAKDPDVNVDKLERLLSLQKEILAEEAKAAFNQSLAAFQARCPQLAKSKHIHVTPRGGGPSRYQSSYCTYEDMMAVVQPLMSELGFAASFDTITQQGGLEIVCTLVHRGGHEKSFRLRVPIDKSGNKNDVQAVGSSNSYLRRYSLANALGIVFKDDDDDADAAVRPSADHDIQPATPPTAPAFDRQGAIQQIQARMAEVVPQITDGDMDEIMSLNPWQDAQDSWLHKALTEKGWQRILAKFHQMQGGGEAEESNSNQEPVTTEVSE